MNFFASLFFLADKDKASINDEVNIPEAINAHVNWKVRLQKYVDGQSEEKLDPMVICRDDQCELGKWIHGPATKRFHDDHSFHELRADHAQFHYVAANIVRYMQEGDSAGARALLKGEYSRVSHHVMMLLNELGQHNRST